MLDRLKGLLTLQVVLLFLPQAGPLRRPIAVGNDGYRRFADVRLQRLLTGTDVSQMFVCRGIDGYRRCAVGSDEWGRPRLGLRRRVLRVLVCAGNHPGLSEPEGSGWQWLVAFGA